MNENYLTIKEVCEKFKVSHMTVYREMEKGMPSFKFGGSHRFIESEIVEYYKNKKGGK